MALQISVLTLFLLSYRHDGEKGRRMRRYQIEDIFNRKLRVIKDTKVIARMMRHYEEDKKEPAVTLQEAIGCEPSNYARLRDKELMTQLEIFIHLYKISLTRANMFYAKSLSNDFYIPLWFTDGKTIYYFTEKSIYAIPCAK